ncbi:PLP-dependent aminotransferase family protein [Candidatus Enterococcus leclercqii]|uniref:aminotransferase-like domain-containing protein n=1 Tax=Candidatus Enterococcus leclercqii TaxID=1857218 RepID=UPI001379680D|nr:PLP-dependent aminotransferase family protein [Enterococcus sp. CU9D]KAF1293501.1 GntR family transcriptional regulator [Enterococcus sp. CU9D]
MWQLDRSDKAPLFQQIIAQIIRYIQEGQLTPGDKLPPERKLAALYGVNRSTVNHALEELVSLGWITRRQGSGTEVAKGRWGSRQAPQYQWQLLLRQTPFAPDPYLSGLNTWKAEPDALDLYTGELPASLIPDFRFPAMRWENILAAERRTGPTGYAPLKEIILQRLFENYGIDSTGQDLLITSGSSQGISLILQTLLAPGETIATEEPSFLFSLPLFQPLGIHLEGIACDEEGILPEALERCIIQKKIRFLYLNPTFQNPTGRLMSLVRRQAIIAVCRKHYIPIIEDDVFGELDFSSPLPKLKTLAADQVIYLGSLSKIFGPSIKIGWLLGPKDLIHNLAAAKQRMDVETNIFPQLLADSALRSPEYTTNHAQLMTELKRRRVAFSEALSFATADWQLRKIRGGLYTWLTWRHQPLTRRDWEYFLQEKLLVAPSFLFSNDTMSMRINYTRMDPDQLQVFARRFITVTEKLKQKE